MRTAIAATSALAFLVCIQAACGPKSVTVTPPAAGTTPAPSVNTAALDTVEILESGCEIAAPILGGPAGTLLESLCPAVVTAALDFIAGTGTAAAVSTALGAAQQSAASLQASGAISASQLTYLTAVIQGLNGVATIIEANAGSTAALRDSSAGQPLPGRPALTKDQKQRVEKLRKRAAALEKKAVKPVKSGFIENIGIAIGETLFGGRR